MCLHWQAGCHRGPFSHLLVHKGWPTRYIGRWLYLEADQVLAQDSQKFSCNLLVCTVEAVYNLTRSLHLKNWTGDPCFPKSLDWLTCTGGVSPSVVSLWVNINYLWIWIFTWYLFNLQAGCLLPASCMVLLTAWGFSVQVATCNCVELMSQERFMSSGSIKWNGMLFVWLPLFYRNLASRGLTGNIPLAIKNLTSLTSLWDFLLLTSTVPCCSETGLAH